MLGFFQLVADVPGYQEVEMLEMPGANGTADEWGGGGDDDGDGSVERPPGFVVDYRDGREVTRS